MIGYGDLSSYRVFRDPTSAGAALQRRYRTVGYTPKPPRFRGFARMFGDTGSNYTLIPTVYIGSPGVQILKNNDQDENSDDFWNDSNNGFNFQNVAGTSPMPQIFAGMGTTGANGASTSAGKVFTSVKNLIQTADAAAADPAAANFVQVAENWIVTLNNDLAACVEGTHNDVAGPFGQKNKSNNQWVAYSSACQTFVSDLGQASLALQQAYAAYQAASSPNAGASGSQPTNPSSPNYRTGSQPPTYQQGSTPSYQQGSAPQYNIAPQAQYPAPSLIPGLSNTVLIGGGLALAVVVGGLLLLPKKPAASAA